MSGVPVRAVHRSPSVSSTPHGQPRSRLMGSPGGSRFAPTRITSLDHGFGMHSALVLGFLSVSTGQHGSARKWPKLHL